MATTKDIKETLKKYFYTGVGLAAHSTEAMQKSVNELISQGKMNEEDGRKIVANALRKIEERRPQIEAQYNKAVHEFVRVSTAEIGKLQTKIRQMEKQLKVKKTPATKTKAKKAKAAARRK